MNSKKKFLKTLNDLKKIFSTHQLSSAALEEAMETIKVALSQLPETATTTEEVKRGALNSYPLPSEIESSDYDFALFCDGACRGNPGPGAYGIMAQDGKGDVIFESSGIEFNTTNNKMELEGAIKALEILEDYLIEKGVVPTEPQLHIYVYSDSRYVVDGINDWVHGWKKRGWKKADNKAPENLELWQKLDETRYTFPFVKFIWVKGHDGHPQNERCDKLANETLDSNL